MKRYNFAGKLAIGLAMLVLLSPQVTCATEKVLSFSGTDSYVNLGMPDVLQMTNNSPLTVEGWVYLNAVDTRDMLYSKNDGRKTSGYTHMFGFYENGKIAAYTGSAWREPNPTVTVDTERWLHVAFSFDGTNLTYYIDGESVGTSAFNFNNVAANTVKLGGYDKNSDIDGMKSEIRVWDHARSAQTIAFERYFRLDGDEDGLLGYWPLHEGSGNEVLDYSGNDSTGAVVNATWSINEDLILLPMGSGFHPASPLTLADIETGSEHFTNSNDVDLVTFPLPEGYDSYQITQNGALSGINTSAWNSVTNTLPTQLNFTRPDSDTNIVFYAWFTNSMTNVTLRRSEGTIYYTEVLPVPHVRTTLTREGLTGSNVIVYASDLDLGSTGGVANGTVLEVVDRMALAAEPGNDLTPGEPYVTLAVEGDYPLLLWLKNEAGNTITATATCLVSVVSYSGENIWTGNGSTDLWSDPANWSAGVPVAGQDVTVNSGSLRLTAATADLASFTLAKGATLSVEGWESALKSDEIIVAGTITHAAQTVTEPDSETGEWIPQHRIWLQGSNLTVTATGVLNADYVGYLPGAGPGRSIDDVQGGGGGGYGGHGGSGYGGTLPGPVYGNAADPWQPGSGGGAYSASRPAGGAIRVEMDGALLIDGVVSACGQNGLNLRGTSGSGGGILLQCRTLQGAGTVRADGGVAHGYSGSGGGGRIAMHYNPAAQAALPVSRPEVRFSAVARYGSAEMPVWPEMGTLYLPDMTLLASAPEADVVLANQRFWHVRLIVGSHPSSWHPASLTITNCVVGFVDGFELHVGGDLRMQGIKGVSKPLAGTLQAGLRLYAAASEELYGARLTVARDCIIGSDAWLYPYTSGTNAAIVGVEVGRNLIVADEGGIDADRAGFMPQADNLNGPGAGLNNDSGGSYGGHGGGGSYRPPYGLAALPLEPGSPGGWRVGASYTMSGSGGGVIHVLVGRDIVIDGLLSANGTTGFSYRGPGGSGGSIFLAAARRFSGSGTLQANGGAGNLNRAPGGGGRIAVWHHLPIDTVRQRIATRDVRS